MDSTLDVLQLNVGKQQMVQQSLLNDEGLKGYAVLAISEPHVWRTDKALRIILIYYKN